MGATLASRFFSRFTGAATKHLEWKPGAAPVEAGQKNKGRTFQVNGPLTEELWEEHLSGGRSIGVSPIREDSTASWGAIDVDKYNLDHAAVVEKIKQLRLPLIPCRTKSGGAHLYLFLSEAAPAGRVQKTLQTWAVALGWPSVEIFPKQDSLHAGGKGSPINLPYFCGTETLRYAVGPNGAMTPDEFMDAADAAEVTMDAAEEIELPKDEILEGAPPCLQSMAVGGFPEGARNKSLFALGVYAKQRWPDEWTGYVEEMNRRFLVPPLSADEVIQTVKSLKKRAYFYTCKEAPLIGACNKDICKKARFGIGQGNDDDLGVDIGILRKIDTNPPTWILPVNDVDVYLSTAQLVDQRLWQMAVVERTNVLPKTIKKWAEFVADLLKQVEVHRAPDDSGPDGELWDYLENFCTGRTAPGKDDIMLGLPWAGGGRVLFRSKDFRKALKRESFSMPIKDVWQILHRHGAREEFLNIKGKTVRVWSVPDFQKTEGSFDLPEIPEEDF